MTFRAPLHRYGAGLRVAAGAVFQAQAAVVTCGAAAANPAIAQSTSVITVGTTLEATPAIAPLPFTGLDALPPWVQDRLAARGLDRQAMAQALLDPQGQWLLVETPQGLDPGDRNGTSDIYSICSLRASPCSAEPRPARPATAPAATPPPMPSAIGSPSRARPMTW